MLLLFFSMQLLLFGVVVPAPPQHYSFSSLTSLLFFYGIPSPIFRRCCSYSSSTLFFLLLLLNVIHVLPWHRSSSYSSLTPFLLLNNVPLLVISWHNSCSFSTLILHLLHTTPTPPWHHFYSSYCKYLFIPPQCYWFSFQHCYRSSCIRLVLSPFMFLQVWEEQAFEIQLAFFKPNLKVNLFLFFQMFVSWWFCSLFWLSMFFMDNVD